MTRPVVITGEFTGKNVPWIQTRAIGRMKIARNWTPYPGEPWALDNGAFRMWNAAQKSGQPVSYVWKEFEKRLAEAAELARKGTPPLFVVIPDQVADECSLEYSLRWLEELEQNGLEELDPMAWVYGPRYGAMPFYLAVQDGMTPEALEAMVDVETDEPILAKFAGIFLGGSVAWKERTAASWRSLTRAWGMRFHYARAGTPRKLRHAHEVGADSVDSATFLWTVDRREAFYQAWLGLELPPDQLSLEVA